MYYFWHPTHTCITSETLNTPVWLGEHAKSKVQVTSHNMRTSEWLSERDGKDNPNNWDRYSKWLDKMIQMTREDNPNDQDHQID